MPHPASVINFAKPESRDKEEYIRVTVPRNILKAEWKVPIEPSQ